MAVNLSACLALYHGKRVLGIDLDPQGNFGISYGIDPRQLEFTSYHRRGIPSGGHNKNNKGVSNSLSNLGAVKFDLGQYGEAEGLFTKALDVMMTIPPGQATADQVWLASVFANNLALVYAKQKNYEKAEKAFKASLAGLEKAYGPDYPNLADYLGKYAEFLRGQDREPEARELEARAAAIRRKPRL